MSFQYGWFCKQLIAAFFWQYVTNVTWFRDLLLVQPNISWTAGSWFSIKMLSYQYRKSNCGAKTILWPFNCHNLISYTRMITSWYWIRALIAYWNISYVKYKQQHQNDWPTSQIFRNKKLPSFSCGNEYKVIKYLTRWDRNGRQSICRCHLRMMKMPVVGLKFIHGSSIAHVCILLYRRQAITWRNDDLSHAHVWCLTRPQGINIKFSHFFISN